MAKQIFRQLLGRCVAPLLHCAFSQSVFQHSGGSKPAAVAALGADHLTISVADLNRLSEWYQNVSVSSPGQQTTPILTFGSGD